MSEFGPSATIRQLGVVRDRSGPRVVYRSPGVDFDQEEAALKAAVAFGPRPPGVACPAALFACPLQSGKVAVVQVADLSAEGTDPPLRFHFLLFNRGGYGGDPFTTASIFPPPWDANHPVTDGDAAAIPFVQRSVAEVQAILKAGDGPLLLGTAQALIDGSRVAIRRTAPDSDFVRGLWQLLPDRVRCELWPATFAFSTELGFDVAVLPTEVLGYLAEDQAKDYPEGRYELALQVAAESGDQAELNRLFARKTSKEVLRLALLMVAFALLVAGILKLL